VKRTSIIAAKKKKEQTARGALNPSAIAWDCWTEAPPSSVRRIIMPGMAAVALSAAGKSFEVHEWRGSGPVRLPVHHSDDEAWHVLEGELIFRCSDRTETISAGKTVFVPAGVAHTYTARPGARYLIVLTPRLRALIAALQADREPAHQPEIYRRFDSELRE
jgi:mannose-6-phosphate isomerase-like protein (cupin superfamily)